VVRRLNADERALWRKVVESVRPLHGAPAPEAPVPDEAEPASAKPGAKRVAAPAARTRALPVRKPVPGTTLDGSWDRMLSKGAVSPDMSVDLHGHNLDTAYSLLDDSLARAISNDARLILLITGKPPTGARHPGGRGAIRAAVGDWLAASRHAGNIAAVRGAHPRHGGSGALYIILRRRR
jgi:DNA-nicking Smr family endonuclease